MKGTRRKTAFVAMTLALAFNLSQSTDPFALLVTYAQVPIGKLKGIVVDQHYAVVLNTSITLENESFEKKIIVDQEGAYEIEVPAGTYTVKVEGPPGFYQSQLKFDVTANATKTLNIMLKVVPQKPVKYRKGTLYL